MRCEIFHARALKRALLAASALVLLDAAAFANNLDPAYLEYDGGMTIETTGGTIPDPSAPFPLLVNSFAGISQRDVRALQGNLSAIPPDTMGAVGATQFMETSNGAYAVYDKATGVRTMLEADGVFWTAAGQPNPTFANGDSRILYDARSQRWIVASFAPTLDKIQIAVSTTSNALGSWQSTSFTAFAGGGSAGSIADYPTLAIDDKAIYIGTNDFSGSGTGCNGIQFCGTTLNVINRSDLFGAGAPTTASLKQFFTPYNPNTNCCDAGYAIQGVNQLGNADSGKVVAVAATDYGLLRYNVINPGTAGATETAPVNVDNSPYDANSPGRQPDGSRVIDTLDDRVSSAAWEWHGKIYAEHTITPLGTDHTAVQWEVIDAATNAVIQEGLIGGNGDGYDYFQGAITVNNRGAVVIAYNRSGFATGDANGDGLPDGNVSIFAATFEQNPSGDGGIHLTGQALLYVSPISDYHNGSRESFPPAGRQRWGDYAQVTVDPNDPRYFWIIGEYALGYDSAVSNSRWGTWIAELEVPEPISLSLFGAGLAGVAAMRRRRRRIAKT